MLHRLLLLLRQRQPQRLRGCGCACSLALASHVDHDHVHQCGALAGAPHVLVLVAGHGLVHVVGWHTRCAGQQRDPGQSH